MTGVLDPDQLADKARNSIGHICMHDCKAFCCRKGYLVLEKDQVDTVTQHRQLLLEAEERLNKISDGRVSLKLDGDCPSLKDFACTIYKNPKRPKTCHEFPLFLDTKTKTVRLSNRCLAVKMGKFYPYIREFKQRGFSIIEGDVLLGGELYNLKVESDDKRNSTT